MDLKELQKMTVVKLRDEAHKFEDVKGAIGMDKEELIELLCKKHGIELKKALPKGIGRHALKAKIGALKARQATVLSGEDKKAKHSHRRHIKSLRRRLRKVVATAKKKLKAEAPAAPAT